jgi:predicted dehydrogenase
MGTKPLNIGVMGTADIAVSRVIPSLQNSDRVLVKAIASRDEKKAGKWSRKLGITRYFGSYEEMLDSDEIEAVYIPLVNSLHCQWTIKSLQKGKHVICEKPLGINEDEARMMIRTAREKNVVLMEAFMYRYHPRNTAVFDMVRGGEIGRLRAIESSFSYVLNDETSYLLNRDLGGGALLDVGCYCVNVSRIITGSEPLEVFGTANMTATNVDMTFAGHLRFPGGVISSFHVAMNEELRFGYRVIGDEGLIEVPRAFVSFGKESHILIQKNEVQKRRKFRAVDEYLLEFEHLADLINEDGEPLYAIEDSMKNMHVLQTLVRSASEGKSARV